MFIIVRQWGWTKRTASVLSRYCMFLLLLAACSSQNDPAVPLAHEKNLNTDEEAALDITLSGFDADGSITSYTIMAMPSSGILFGDPPNLVYTPNVDFSGEDNFSYTVTDNSGQTSAAANVTITVTPMSRATRTDYVEAVGEVQNPERGFYRTIDMNDVNSVSVAQLGTWPPGMPGSDLVLFKYFLTDYCNQTTLPGAHLDILDTILNEVRDLAMKVVLRVIYSNSDGSTNTCGTTDAATLGIAEGHLDQMATKLSMHKDVIAVMEAGIFGAWGEWNDSNVPPSSGMWNDSNNRRAILDKLIQSLPADRSVVVRRPRFKRELEVGMSPMPVADSSRIGFHNDCVLANYDDSGSYDDPDNLAPGLPNYDSGVDLVQNWRSYINYETVNVPMGGETCAVSAYSTCAQAQIIFKKMRFSYLNNEWHWLMAGGGVINEWESNACFEIIRQSLGYRLVVTQVQYTDQVPPGGKLELQVDIENKGWAPVYNPRPVKVILRGPETHEITLQQALKSDPRQWLPETTTTLYARLRIPATTMEGSYTVTLQLPDADAGTSGSALKMAAPEYNIQFANTGLWNMVSGDNQLMMIDVDSTAVGGVDSSVTVLQEF